MSVNCKRLKWGCISWNILKNWCYKYNLKGKVEAKFIPFELAI